MLRRNGPLTFVKEWRGTGVVELRRKLYYAAAGSSSARIRKLGITMAFISQSKYDAFDLHWAMISAIRGGWHRIFADWVKEHPKSAKEEEPEQMALTI